jgi:hypothetical protein
MKSELAIINFNCYEDGGGINRISRDDLKLIIDLSIQNLYGILEASKIIYSIEIENKTYRVKTPEK